MDNQCSDNIVKMVRELIQWAERYADLKKEVERLEDRESILRDRINELEKREPKKP